MIFWRIAAVMTRLQMSLRSSLDFSRAALVSHDHVISRSYLSRLRAIWLMNDFASTTCRHLSVRHCFALSLQWYSLVYIDIDVAKNFSYFGLPRMILENLTRKCPVYVRSTRPCSTHYVFDILVCINHNTIVRISIAKCPFYLFWQIWMPTCDRCLVIVHSILWWNMFFHPYKYMCKRFFPLNDFHECDFPFKSRMWHFGAKCDVIVITLKQCQQVCK